MNIGRHRVTPESKNDGCHGHRIFPTVAAKALANMCSQYSSYYMVKLSIPLMNVRNVVAITKPYESLCSRFPDNVRQMDLAPDHQDALDCSASQTCTAIS
jgi:hypothetical protein